MPVNDGSIYQFRNSIMRLNIIITIPSLINDLQSMPTLNLHCSIGILFTPFILQALAAKTVLWPIAGIALLGAAAALVSNPILLQLGVVSGKRRRRDTEEVTGPDFPSGAFKKYEDKINEQSNETKDVYHLKEDLRKKSKQNKILKFASLTATTKGRIFKTDNLKNVQNNIGVRKVRSSVKRNIEQVTKSPPNFSSNNDDDDRFIPIPIKIRTPKVTD